MAANDTGPERERGSNARSSIPAATPPSLPPVPVRGFEGRPAALKPLPQGPAPEYGPIAGFCLRNAPREHAGRVLAAGECIETRVRPAGFDTRLRGLLNRPRLPRPPA